MIIVAEENLIQTNDVQTATPTAPATVSTSQTIHREPVEHQGPSG